MMRKVWFLFFVLGSFSSSAFVLLEQSSPTTKTVLGATKLILGEFREKNPELGKQLQREEELFWRRIRTELFGGPTCSAPPSLERLERYMERKEQWETDVADFFFDDRRRRQVHFTENYPDLETKPIWDASEPWMTKLAERTDDLARWLDPERNEYKPAFLAYATDEKVDKGYQTMGLDLKNDDDGQFVEVKEIIRAARPSVAPRVCGIGKMVAGKVLHEHADKCPWMLTFHLPLVDAGADEAFMVVDKKKLPWVKGQPLVFDTTYRHSAKNTSPDRDVYVLHLDFMHPGLTPDEAYALRLIARYQNTFKKRRRDMFDSANFAPSNDTIDPLRVGERRRRRQAKVDRDAQDAKARFDHAQTAGRPTYSRGPP